MTPPAGTAGCTIPSIRRRPRRTISPIHGRRRISATRPARRPRFAPTARPFAPGRARPLPATTRPGARAERRLHSAALDRQMARMRHPESAIANSARAHRAAARRTSRIVCLGSLVVAGLGLPGPAFADKISHPTAVFEGLDKITGRTISFEVAINETVQFGTLQITPRVCYSRPPTEAPQTDAFAQVDQIDEKKNLKRIFSGWMFADSPGLHGIEHPIYDIWLTGCKGGTTIIHEAPAVRGRRARPGRQSAPRRGDRSEPGATACRRPAEEAQAEAEDGRRPGAGQRRSARTRRGAGAGQRALALKTAGRSARAPHIPSPGGLRPPPSPA